MSALTSTLQTFFTTYLTGQKAASHHTIASYRDTWGTAARRGDSLSVMLREQLSL